MVVAMFPGQGSQRIGMGQAVAQRFPDAAEIYRAAGRATGRDVEQLCWRGPAEQLNDTRNAQLGLLATCLATLTAWQRQHGASSGGSVLAYAGHSVGAVTAAVAANFLSFEDGAKLVAQRGQLMATAPGTGSMLAVAVGSGSPDGLLDMADRLGLDVAARNGPRQLVLSGPTAAIEAARSQLRGRAKQLTVSHAFHSRMMRPVLDQWRAAVRALRLHTPTHPVITNCTGQLTEDPEELREDLMDSLVTTVDWTAVMTAAVAVREREDAPDRARWIAFGPADAIRSARRHMPGAPDVEIIETPAAVLAVTP